MDSQQRGREASRLLDSEIMDEVWAAARLAFMEEWTKAETAVHREMCHAKVMGLEEVQRQLRRMVNEGEHTSHAARQAEKAAGLPQD